ncbi:MAG: DUF1295 domain-containing protein [Candidatus Babeliales bacterium]
MTIFVTVLFFIFVYMNFLFLIAHYKNDVSIVDMGWAGGFMLVALTSLLQGEHTVRGYIATFLIFIWGCRLTWHIVSRHKGEDPRYTALKKSWGTYAGIKIYGYIFMFQGLLILLISYPLLLINSAGCADFSFFDVSLFMLWIIGFVFEVAGDYQLKMFLANPANKGKVCEYGLWRFTRHPNYFGELCMWFALNLLALGCSYGFTSFISIITLIIIFTIFSIPITEAQFAHNPAYQEYKKKTPALIPMPFF